MTWAQFKTLIIRTNALVIGLGWVLLWGYGIAVGDIPPASVILALLLLSVIGVIGITVILLIAYHTGLFVIAQKNGQLSPLAPIYRYALYLSGFLAILAIATGILAGSKGVGFDGFIDGFGAVVGGFGGVGAFIVFLSGFKDQYFQWFFTSQ